MWRHGRRHRKTGPRLAVTVLLCRRHSRHFTVYPVGYVPYGRELVAPVATDGEPPADAASGVASAWDTTFFPRSDSGGGRESLAS